LHYRISPYKHPIPLRDAQRALRLVRSRAREWKVDDEKIGIWGFSAGGHLAACCATLWDEGQPRSSDAVEEASCRPDFAVLAYPVITFVEDFMHRGSRDNLLGENPDPELAQRLSPDQQVNERTPPTFLFHTTADDVVRVQNSIAFYAALQAHHTPAELHVYEHGPHGVGLAQDDAVLSTWTERLEIWLRDRTHC
jgi:acetyl esterase/lipase